MSHFDDGIFISSRTLASLSASSRAEVFTSVFGGRLSVETHTPGGNSAEEGGGDLADGLPPLPDNIVGLDNDQARAVLAPPMHKKTRAFLRAIAMKATPLFELAEIAAEIGEPANKLRGVFSGITTRVRSVIKRDDGLLIDWYGEPKYNSSHVYVGQAARLRPDAHSALKALCEAQAKVV